MYWGQKLLNLLTNLVTTLIVVTEVPSLVFQSTCEKISLGGKEYIKLHIYYLFISIENCFFMLLKITKYFIFYF